MEFNIEKPLDKIIGKVEVWAETFISMLPNMAVSALLLILFVLLGKLGQRIFVKVFHKASDNEALENLFSTIIYYTIVGLGFFIILSILQLDKAVSSLLAGVGVMGLALGFAFQDITANFISGVILAFRTPFNIGDIVELQDTMGVVSRTNLRVTVIQTFNGQEVYIPNKEVLQNPITNYTTIGKRRINLAVGVSYGDNLEKVEKLVLETVNNLEGVIDQDKTIFDYEAFGDSSINFNIRFWIEYPDQPGYFKVLTSAIKAIKRAFDQEDIMIPFPIRTLDFGIRGGEKLSEMKLAVNGNIEKYGEKSSKE